MDYVSEINPGKLLTKKARNRPANRLAEAVQMAMVNAESHVRSIDAQKQSMQVTSHIKNTLCRHFNKSRNTNCSENTLYT
jgi:hypothetical protein